MTPTAIPASAPGESLWEPEDGKAGDSVEGRSECVDDGELVDFVVELGSVADSDQSSGCHFPSFIWSFSGLVESVESFESAESFESFESVGSSFSAFVSLFV